ncbi:ROK family transcriptional regulator [uncultured Arthrobacter sp.]|uniref:ROK family transcriptional regulator n=1 Tax=uncultured Arthrobacter sp. TaxID=114050 RepID=UPI002604A991|nr:ROK family transcriptional regulator [uncultured Arthrobacter sp.]
MGDFNQSVILDAIRRSSEGLSRVELVDLIGLSPQAVSNITRRLLAEELIVEAGKSGSGPGKPRTILRINPSGRYAIGVHLDPALMTVVLMDLMGVVLHRRVRETPLNTEPGQIIDAIAGEVRALLAESPVDPARIEGIGVAPPGPIDQPAGAVVDPPLLLGWHRVPLRDALAEATEMPVFVEKDVTAAAVAEIWGGGHGSTQSFVFIYIGTGIGSGIVVDGEVLRGTSGNAGEIGHIVTDPNGPECACGMRGCIAVTCDPQSLVLEAERLGVLNGERHRNGDVADGLLSLCAAADEGNELAVQILTRAAVRTARAVSVLANLLDVDRVVFGGPFWAPLASRYLEVVPSSLLDFRAARSIHPVEVVSTGIGNDVAAVGAACLMLERTLGPRADRLMLAR